MDTNLKFAWNLARGWPLRRRVPMQVAVLLYAIGLCALAVRLPAAL